MSKMNKSVSCRNTTSGMDSLMIVVCLSGSTKGKHVASGTDPWRFWTIRALPSANTADVIDPLTIQFETNLLFLKLDSSGNKTTISLAIDKKLRIRDEP